MILCRGKFYDRLGSFVKGNNEVILAQAARLR